MFHWGFLLIARLSGLRLRQGRVAVGIKKKRSHPREPQKSPDCFWLFRFVSLHPMIHNILPFPDHPSDYAYFSIYSRWLVLSRVSVFSGESRKVLWWCVECSLSAVFDFACSPFSTQLSHHSFNDDDNDHGVLILSITSPQNRLVALIYYTRSASNHDVIHNREGHKMLDFSEK